MLSILSIHTDNIGPGRVNIYVAVESDPGKWIAFHGSVSNLSEYHIRMIVERGKEMPEENAKYIFSRLASELEYVKGIPREPAAAPPDPLLSLSDLYEKAKDIINGEMGTTAGEELHAVLRQIRDLAAPAIVKTMPLASG